MFPKSTEEIGAASSWPQCKLVEPYLQFFRQLYIFQSLFTFILLQIEHKLGQNWVDWEVMKIILELIDVNRMTQLAVITDMLSCVWFDVKLFFIFFFFCVCVCVCFLAFCSLDLDLSVHICTHLS